MLLALTIIVGVAIAGAFYACCVVASRADEMYYKYKYGKDDKNGSKTS